jgi:hypothetical protein
VDIPAYVLELPAPTGPPREAREAEARGAGPFVQVRSADDGARYRVYAGAYADAHEVAHLAELLAREGESRSPLSAQTGRHIE